MADPGFDLRGRGLCQQGGGCKKIIKVLKVELKVFLACFGHFSIKMMLKINRERSERRKISAPGAPAPPPGSASVHSVTRLMVL